LTTVITPLPANIPLRWDSSVPFHPTAPVDVRAKVQVFVLRPFAQPVLAVPNGLVRWLCWKKPAAGRAEAESAVRHGGNAPAALVDQMMVDRTLCRLSDYPDFGGPRPIGFGGRAAVSVWAGGIIKARSERPAGGREAGNDGRPRR
jgi:hypothetical protein